MYKQKLWYVSICITMISLIVISVGFVKAMNFAAVPPTVPNNSTSQNARLTNVTLFQHPSQENQM